MEYKIVSSSSPQGLTNTINSLMNEGWEPMGSHQVVIVREQNRFRGDQHIDTTNESQIWNDAVKRPHKILPWLALSNGKSGFEGPLPTNINDMMTLLKKYSDS